MSKKIVSMTLLALSIATLIVLGTRAHARARLVCSNTTVQGSYGVKGTGTAVSGAIAGPVAFIGIVNFDGMGQLSGNLSIRLNSASGPTTQIKVPIVGTYTVNADCSGEDIWRNSLTGAFNIHELVVVDKGEELFFLVTTPNSPGIVTIVGRRQFGGDSDRD